MTDIVGSTEHASELGDTGWRELVELHHSTIRAALKRHGGREIDTAGDGFFVIFDAPAAAVRCALEIVEQVHELGLGVRAGIHVGEVEQMGAKVSGITVPIASRIMSAAEPGDVLVSSTVRDLAAGSGFKFEDRGVRELKGVSGEWHIFRVVSEVVEESTEGAANAGARERRAAAVRRSQARPIWQRRPRLVSAMAVLLALVLATTGLLVWKPWQAPALASVPENAIGVIDPERGEIVAQIPAGTQPSDIAVSDGYAWVANTGSDTVSQIDLAKRLAIRVVDVGKAPKGLAIAAGAVWVANSGARTVSRINIETGRVVDTIEVGNGPSEMTVAGNLLWVANSTDNALVSIDPQADSIGERVAMGDTPVALVGDETALWVATEKAVSGASVGSSTSTTFNPPIPLSARPRALALDQRSVWVAAADGTVTRIDRSTNRVNATVDVGGRPTAIIAVDDSVWVSDEGGGVYRLDSTNPSVPPERVSTVSPINSLAATDDAILVAAQASAASHRGGTLREASSERYGTDPLFGGPEHSALMFTADGLTGFRRVGGTAGSALLPDLAVAIPPPTDGGRIYTFQLRPNLTYASGESVQAADFRRAAERSFQIDAFGLPRGYIYFNKVVGAEACMNVDGLPVERCDLQAGVLTDEQTRTVTFHLTEPDADFPYKLAVPPAFPVPEGTPMNEPVDGAFPGTGPYLVTASSETEVRLGRNPRFVSWDADVRPDGFVDEMVFEVVEDEPIAMVGSGDADYANSIRVNVDNARQFAIQFPDRWHSLAIGTRYVVMNSSMAPFDNADARRAVSFAIDRARMVDLLPGPQGAAVTCQLLPPGYPGYEPYCPYTENPGSGRWEHADLSAAKALVDSSGTRGAHIVVGPAMFFQQGQLEYLASVLRDLGYEVSMAPEIDEIPQVFAEWQKGQTQITFNGWAPDYLGSSTFMGLYTCGGDQSGVMQYCDADFDAAYAHALELQATDRSAAVTEWAALDRRAVDLAVFAPLYNEGGDFISARIGNYSFSPSGYPLLDQMWVQ